MYFDIIAICFVVLFSVYMMKRGGVKAVLSLTSFVLSVIVAVCCYPAVTDWIYQTTLPETVEERVYDMLEGDKENASDAAIDEDSIGAIDAMPDFVREHITIEKDKATDIIREKVAEDISYLLIKVISFVIVVIVTKLILAVLTSVLNITAKLPVLKQLNGIVGLLGGLIVSLLVVWVAVWAVNTLSLSNEAALKIAQESYVVEFMSNIAPF